MKLYLVWFKSGNCIQGRMDDSEAKRLETEFSQGDVIIGEYQDSDGVLKIRIGNIEAVAISDVIAENKIGFGKGK